ncbi:MAG: A/G-specific adenine glycosylase [Candidatus Azobacteroides sp.]|nr:A/G-specific adenine glycosylase [Candidatus Azobacteroides sp.]
MIEKERNDFEGELDSFFISSKLIDWFERNKRDLPWRGIDDPYKIWISEIILQQTRVNQGWDYYTRFIERFPDVKSLSEAEEVEVLKYWQGLGYYSRARNLHAAAKMITEQFAGEFPNDYNVALKLKGIGEYTAAAIVSFVWNKPYPVVDGNVFRFLSRLLGIEEPIDTGKGKKLFTKIAGKLMDTEHAGIFNQAIMEFGALQCIPISPDCNTCPFSDICFAFNSKQITDFPVKQNKVKTKTRHFYYFHIQSGEYTYLNKRTSKDIWQNLYEFPCIESEKSLSFEELQQMEQFKQLFPLSAQTQCKLVIHNKKHVLTHRILYADFYKIILSKEPESLSVFTKIRSKDIDIYPIHRLMQFYLEK